MFVVLLTTPPLTPSVNCVAHCKGLPLSIRVSVRKLQRYFLRARPIFLTYKHNMNVHNHSAQQEVHPIQALICLPQRVVWDPVTNTTHHPRTIVQAVWIGGPLVELLCQHRLSHALLAASPTQTPIGQPRDPVSYNRKYNG